MSYTSSNIPVYRPTIDNTSVQYVVDALTSGWVSWRGKYIQEAIKHLSVLCNVKHVVLTCNGTAATHCLFCALRYKYPTCRKIYVPNHSYIAVWNTVMQEYPEYEIEALDVNVETWNTDFSLDVLDHLEQKACVMIVHHFSGIVDVPELKRRRPDLIFVEDNCEGFLGRYSNGDYTGSASLCSSISFFANKTATCGEGGAFCTNDVDVWHHIYKFCHQGVTQEQYIHDMPAVNYRMTNIQAAMLCGQLNELENTLAKKKHIMNSYIVEMSKHTLLANYISFQHHPKNTVPSYWMCGCVIRHPKHQEYKDVEQWFLDRGIETRPFFYPITRHPHLRGIKCISIKGASYISQHGLILPSYPDLKEDEIQHVIQTLQSYMLHLETI